MNASCVIPRRFRSRRMPRPIRPRSTPATLTARSSGLFGSVLCAITVVLFAGSVASGRLELLGGVTLGASGTPDRVRGDDVFLCGEICSGLGERVGIEGCPQTIGCRGLAPARWRPPLSCSAREARRCIACEIAVKLHFVPPSALARAWLALGFCGTRVILCNSGDADRPITWVVWIAVVSDPVAALLAQQDAANQIGTNILTIVTLWVR